jgi:hypothetical protein
MVGAICVGFEVGSFCAVETVWKFMPKIAGTHAGARRPVQDLVREMLVRPRLRSPAARATSKIVFTLRYWCG